jgi:hypothetical protein
LLRSSRKSEAMSSWAAQNLDQIPHVRNTSLVRACPRCRLGAHTGRQTIRHDRRIVVVDGAVARRHGLGSFSALISNLCSLACLAHAWQRRLPSLADRAALSRTGSRIRSRTMWCPPETTLPLSHNRWIPVLRHNGYNKWTVRSGYPNGLFTSGRAPLKAH